ncbi:MAG: TRAP transporter substrate-binding protein DctP [Tissierellaceae bacterium]|nr:TRAP transporter substrate-binding protein DctP [Tissierellaceae bacterium]
MNKKNITFVLLLVFVMAIASGCSTGADAKDQIVWRFGHEEIRGSIQDAYALEFKRLVEERSNGEIYVEVYRADEIGGVMDYLEFQQKGLLAFSILNPGTTATTIPENNVFYNHFLLPEEDDDLQELFATSEAITMLNKLNEENDLKVLDWFYEGFNAWTANKPIRSPQDFRGVSIRTMASPLIVSSYAAYNANPTPMPYSEVYTGLQLKQIDAQVNPVFAIEEMNFYEVQDYLIQARQDGFVASLVTSPDFWAELDAKTQAMVLDIVPELNDYIFDFQAKLNQERLDIIRASGNIEIIDLTEEERAVFREAAMPVREVFLRSVGEEGAEILRILDEDAQRIIEKNKDN